MMISGSGRNWRGAGVLNTCEYFKIMPNKLLGEKNKFE
jgi:hypothetical protein